MRDSVDKKSNKTNDQSNIQVENINDSNYLNPFDIIPIEDRWYSDKKIIEEKGYDCLLPPLVEKIRKSVYSWRESGYPKRDGDDKTIIT